MPTAKQHAARAASSEQDIAPRRAGGEQNGAVSALTLAAQDDAARAYGERGPDFESSALQQHRPADAVGILRQL